MKNLSIETIKIEIDKALYRKLLHRCVDFKIEGKSKQRILGLLLEHGYKNIDAIFTDYCPACLAKGVYTVGKIQGYDSSQKFCEKHLAEAYINGEEEQC